MRRIVSGIILVLGLVSPGAAQKKPSNTFYPTPLTATLRCVATSACVTTDRVVADTGPYTGVVSTTEGAFINANGGFSLHILKGGSSPDRYVRLDFTEQLIAYGECPAISPVIDSTDFDLRVNVHDPNGAPIGVANLAVGVPYQAFGKINFTDPARRKNNAYTVRFEDGQLTITRTALNAWVIESTRLQSAFVECGSGTTNQLEGRYALPFRIEAIQ